MHINFYKYQGTGNDFILIDNRLNSFQADSLPIKKLCDRRFGIGADGLILLQNLTGYDFRMQYFNSDGRESTMCGNGGRCITAFAQKLGIIDSRAKFLAADGPHQATIDGNKVSLGMQDVSGIEIAEEYFFLNTGSPHVVKFVENIYEFPVIEEAKKIRYNQRFNQKGTNVNFVERKNGNLIVRTYERGVEDETFSCGTGVTAAALVEAIKKQTSENNEIMVVTKGGELSVRYKKNGRDNFQDIYLSGNTEFVFEGSIAISNE